MKKGVLLIVVVFQNYKFYFLLLFIILFIYSGMGVLLMVEGSFFVIQKEFFCCNKGSFFDSIQWKKISLWIIHAREQRLFANKALLWPEIRSDHNIMWLGRINDKRSFFFQKLTKGVSFFKKQNVPRLWDNSNCIHGETGEGIEKHRVKRNTLHDKRSFIYQNYIF